MLQIQVIHNLICNLLEERHNMKMFLACCKQIFCNETHYSIPCLIHMLSWEDESSFLLQLSVLSIHTKNKRLCSFHERILKQEGFSNHIDIFSVTFSKMCKRENLKDWHIQRNSWYTSFLIVLMWDIFQCSQTDSWHDQ